ncbi:hypothetical protein NL533_35380, partial [Klebsiella pneumoniae]|nr:hypothetical protein [Klebsiella pneumoniae]
AQLAELADGRLITDVPVQSPTGGVLGVAGASRAVDGLLRSLVMDAAVHHAPSSLSIHLLADGDEWDYALWLPHVADSTV